LAYVCMVSYPSVKKFITLWNVQLELFIIILRIFLLVIFIINRGIVFMLNTRIYSNSSSLRDRLKDDKKPITFVLGSAISRKINGSGVSDVAEIVSYLKNIIKDKNHIDKYNNFLAENDLNDEYKSLFEYVAITDGQNRINEIIRELVLSNIDKDTGRHKIPTPVSDFTNAIINNEFNVANIVTTNFDTLIEESFKENGVKTNSYTMVSDSHLPDGHNGDMNIFHIHGKWDRNDSMHSHSQLNVGRKKLEGSLHELFLNTSVVIMAYGGWEDSFTRTLSQIVNHPNADYNIAWCFFQKANDAIEKSFGPWFEKLETARARGRIQFFKGIDCTNFFKIEENSDDQKKK